MKQVLQSLKNGATEVAEVPAPMAGSGRLLIRTSTTLVSAGTERMLVEFGKGNLLSKARQQPEKVAAVLAKARTDGVAATLDAVRSKLDQPLALGYCNVGTLIEAGSGVTGYRTGDRIVSNGAHAEIVAVPRNLCARIPDEVSNETAAFTVLAAIGLQGIRLVAPTLGECIVVTGLGLIGLLTVQMLRAQGCRVLGIDFDPARLALARQFGAETVNPGAGEDVLSRAHDFSGGRGVDAVIITASAKSNEPMSQAANMCRKRGRIVLVGVVGLELSRADFYEKELSFQVSCSYGPGRYDSAYEEGGNDYPIGFVRWTEQRNFEAVLQLMASGAIDVSALVSHRFALAEAEAAFGLLVSGEPSLGILLDYGRAQATAEIERTVSLNPAPVAAKASMAFLGSGNYAGRILIPAFKAAGAGIETVISSGGVSAVHHGRKNGAANASTDLASAYDNDRVDTVVIATRHNAHAGQVLAALKAGKHVFCEKPLCLTLDELEQIRAEASTRPAQHLMVGFNRRFAPQVAKMKALVAPLSDPKAFVMTVNAGAIPPEHWTQDSAIGGGRIVGEACHFIDLLRFLAGAPIMSCTAHPMGNVSGAEPDSVVISLGFADGSVGTINYFANGHQRVPKERLDLFCGGKVLQLDNFRSLKGHGWKGFSRMSLWSQDKGQGACARAFVAAIQQGRTSPIAADEIFEVSRFAIVAAEQARAGGG